MTDRGEKTLGEIRALGVERRRSRLDRSGHLLQRHAPERMLAGERLPQQDADSPDVARGTGLLSAQPFGRDVRQRARNVADGGQRLGLVELREPKVEQAHRDAVALGQQHVRRLHVPVDDAARVGVCESVEDLSGRLDGLAVAQRAPAHGLPQRAAADVLVCDVDVAGIRAEAIRAQAALVPQPRRRLGFAFGPVRGLALARDDLECDLEPRALVPCEPDGARAATPEGS